MPHAINSLENVKNKYYKLQKNKDVSLCRMCYFFGRLFPCVFSASNLLSQVPAAKQGKGSFCRLSRFVGALSHFSHLMYFPHLI